ncbi:MAG: hypothetical protein JKY09_05590 [Crocinitomicaceae bacterium]|nr:hypothetical protein [Crocinitomicaceae bacterium]
MLDLSKTYTYTGVDNERYNYYGDYQDANRFYIEPKIEFAIAPDTNLPKFKAVQYQTSDSYNGSGYCTFTAEIKTPNDIINKVIVDIKAKNLSQNPIISPLEYMDGGKAHFQYPNPKDPGKYLYATATTSALGQNQASFLVQFGTDEMNAFIETYKKEGNKGFPLQFFQKVNGVAPACTVEIEYDSKIERKYQKEKESNVWGKNGQTGIDKITIPDDMGIVTVTPGVNSERIPNKALIEKMREWGQDQLNEQVQKMVDRSKEMKESKSSSMWTQSFKRKYQENQVVPWGINPVGQLPSPVTKEADWNRFFSTVDLRRFTLKISMNVDDRKLPHEQKVKSITVNVKYPGLNSPQNSVVLTPANQSHIFESPIAAGGNLTYEWNYVVTYNDGTQLRVVKNKETNSAATISAPDVGILNVEFNTSYIDFKKNNTGKGIAVRGLEVDFFYKDLSGQDNPVMQKILFGFPTSDNDQEPGYEHPLTYNFVSKTAKPIFNNYIYTPKFIMTDGTILVGDSVDENANIAMDDIGDLSRDNIIYLHGAVNPVQYTLEFIPEEGSEIMAYNVKVNKIEADGSLNFVGQTKFSPPKVLDGAFETTTLNPASQLYSISGTMITRKKPIIIPSYITTDDDLYLFENQRSFSVEIDPRLLRFKEDGLSMVEVAIGEKEDKLYARNFIKGIPKSQYYNFYHDKKDAPSYYIKVTYSYVNSSSKIVEYKGNTINTFVIPASPDLQKTININREKTLVSNN